jgi:hypothetical protein
MSLTSSVEGIVLWYLSAVVFAGAQRFFSGAGAQRDLLGRNLHQRPYDARTSLLVGEYCTLHLFSSKMSLTSSVEGIVLWYLSAVEFAGAQHIFWGAITPGAV